MIIIRILIIKNGANLKVLIMVFKISLMMALTEMKTLF